MYVAIQKLTLKISLPLYLFYKNNHVTTTRGLQNITTRVTSHKSEIALAHSVAFQPFSPLFLAQTKLH